MVLGTILGYLKLVINVIWLIVASVLVYTLATNMKSITEGLDAIKNLNSSLERFSEECKTQNVEQTQLKDS